MLHGTFLLHLDPALFLQSTQRILDDTKHLSFKKVPEVPDVLSVKTLNNCFPIN